VGEATNLLTSGVRARAPILPSDVKAAATPEELAALQPTSGDALRTLLSIATIPTMLSIPGLVGHMAVAGIQKSKEASRAELAKELIARRTQERGGEITTGGELALQKQRAADILKQQTAAGQEELGRQVVTGQLRGTQEQQNALLQQKEMFDRQAQLNEQTFGHQIYLEQLRQSGTEVPKEEKVLNQYLTALRDTQGMMIQSSIFAGTDPNSKAAMKNLGKLQYVLSQLASDQLKKATNMSPDQIASLEKMFAQIRESAIPQEPKDILLNPNAPTSWDQYKGGK
jgi:hypothetical protein